MRVRYIRSVLRGSTIDCDGLDDAGNELPVRTFEIPADGSAFDVPDAYGRVLCTCGHDFLQVYGPVSGGLQAPEAGPTVEVAPARPAVEPLPPEAANLAPSDPVPAPSPAKATPQAPWTPSAGKRARK